jgi:hypothetical protein
MADLEAVLADVSYLMAMERSKAPAAKTIKKLTLPDARLAKASFSRKFPGSLVFVAGKWHFALVTYSQCGAPAFSARGNISL